ncbi:MAG: glycosyltransferase WbuB, partial [Sphingobacteriales bacterium]
MHILYLHQYFLTPEEAGAIRSYYISKALVAAGHKVTVITSHNQPHYKVKNIEGIEVHYLPVVYENHFGKTKRVLAFLKFMWYGFNLALDLPRKDLVFATSTPLTVGVTAIALKWIEKIPFVFEVRDLWPEAPIQLGYIRTPVLRQALRWLEKLIYKQAQHVIALSPGIAAGVKKAAPRAPLSMLPNMADCDFYQPAEKPEFYKDLPVKENFVLSYTGALGRANRVSFLLDVAEACLKDQLKNVLILIAGSGAEEENLRRDAAERNLSNLHFLGSLDHFEVREVLNASDATYTSFDTLPILQTNSPNKFFDSLAAGKICLVNTRGWLRELVEEHRCGLYCDPEDPASVVEAIKLLRSSHGL